MRCVHKSARKLSVTKKNSQHCKNMLTENATTYTFYTKKASKRYVPVCKIKAVSVATEASKPTDLELPPTSKSHQATYM